MATTTGARWAAGAAVAVALTLVAAPAFAARSARAGTSTTIGTSAGNETSDSTTTTTTIGAGGSGGSSGVSGPTGAGTTTTTAGTDAGASTTTTTVTGASGSVSNPLCTPGVIAQVQQRVESDLSGRVTHLQALLQEVQSGKNHLTSSDQSTLEQDISTVELPGIESLQGEVQSATTCAELRTDAHSMVYDYRVYVVMSPQTHETIAADHETYVDGLLSAVEPKIEVAIADAQGHGKDVTAAQAAFGDMQSRVSAASSAVSGLSATLLAQTPTGYPGNASVFRNAWTSESSARTDLRAAYADLAKIAAAFGLKSAASSTTTSATPSTTS